MRIISILKQWKNWSRANKLTAFGILIGLISLIITLVVFFDHSLFKDEIDSTKKEIYPPSRNYEIEINSQNVKLSIPDNELLEEFPFAMKNYDITYPEVMFKNNTYVEGKINDLIRKELLLWNINIDSIEKSTWAGEVFITYEIYYKIHNLLGICFTIDWYGTGAAHGNQSIHTYNINLVNGETFKYMDIFDNAKLEIIKQLLIQKLYDHECYCIDDEIKFEDSNDRNFFFEDDGLIIIFHKYEIACGACGPIKIKLFYNEIKELINQNGPLKFLY